MNAVGKNALTNQRDVVTPEAFSEIHSLNQATQKLHPRNEDDERGHAEQMNHVPSICKSQLATAALEGDQFRSAFEITRAQANTRYRKWQVNEKE